MFCTTCGSSLPSDAAFCPRCGTEASALATRGEPPILVRGRPQPSFGLSGWQMGARVPNHPLALASFGLGVSAWVAVPVVGAVGAIVTGHLARRAIRKTGAGGTQLANWGLIMGYVQMLMVVAVMVAVILFYRSLLDFYR